MIWMNGWVWMIAALVLAALELILPGWFFLGSAIAAAIMGAMILMGLWTGGLPMALVVVAVLTGVSWFVMRRLMGSQKGQVRIWDRDINDN
ncbi:hypothetical protein [Paracoccus sulfuroxidans]|uniref:NfeD-like partner-binding protein n=1 Tax=Paracoccus sulfuroxidans TaxID=384678 RepID=A0A562NMP7_9RHOB|nr:hypothetical protein [Paracoccus sulfuroxidans]TWI33444.1 NfeD-like partner-binding protein [Paracoccus sulfuroxidans]